MKPKTVLCLVGDLHINSTTALIHPAVNLDDGGTYRANKYQIWIWRRWKDYWKEAAKYKATGCRLIGVINGETCDHPRFATTQIITGNIASIVDMTAKTLGPALEVCDEWIITRGTEAHVGKSGELDELIAHDIGAIGDDRNGTDSWWQFRGEVEGVRLHIQHHTLSSYMRPWTKGGGANRTAVMIMHQYINQGITPPNLAIFGHSHRPEDSGDNHPVRAVVLPSWQLTNAYGYRLGGNPLPVGGAFLKLYGGGEYQLVKRSNMWPIKSGYKRL